LRTKGFECPVFGSLIKTDPKDQQKPEPGEGFDFFESELRHGEKMGRGSEMARAGSKKEEIEAHTESPRHRVKYSFLNPKRI
jgi:hypothetical protein